VAFERSYRPDPQEGGSPVCRRAHGSRSGGVPSDQQDRAGRLRVQALDEGLLAPNETFGHHQSHGPMIPDGSRQVETGYATMSY